MLKELVAMVAAEEKSLLEGANVLDPDGKICTNISADQTVRNFMIGPQFRWKNKVVENNVDTDGSADFTIDLGGTHGIRTVFIMADDWDQNWVRA